MLSVLWVLWVLWVPLRRALLRQQAFRDAARVDRQAAVVADAAQSRRQRRIAFHRQQLEHLAVAVLVDDVHALVLPDELLDGRRERERAQAQIRRVEAAFFLQLIAGLLHRKVARAIRDDADLGALYGLDDRLRHVRPGRLGLLAQAIHVGDVVVGPLAVLRHRVVAGSAREVRRAFG